MAPLSKVQHKDKITKQHRFEIINSKNHTRTLLLEVSHFDVKAWDYEKGILGLAGTPFPKMGKESKAGLVEAYYVQHGAAYKVGSANVPMVTENLERRNFTGSDFAFFNISQKGTRAVVTTKWKDGWEMDWTDEKGGRLFDLMDGGRLVQSFSFEGETEALGFEYTHGEEVQLKTANGKWHYFDVEKGNARIDRPLQLNIQPESKLSVSWNNLGVVTLKSQQDGERTLHGFALNSIKGASLFAERNLLIVLTVDNRLHLYNLKTLNKHLTIANRGHDQWIAYAPDGTFTASLNGTEKVFWSAGDLHLPFRALKDQFERPDLVRKHLDAIFEGSTLQRLVPLMQRRPRVPISQGLT